MGLGRLARMLFSVGGVIFAVIVRATAAMAQAYPGGGQQPPQVKGVRFFHGGGTNANTGMQILIWALLALFFLVAGLVFHLVSRRRSATSVE